MVISKGVFTMYKGSSYFRMKARESLSGRYWYAFGVCILLSLILGLASGIENLITLMLGNAVGIGNIVSIGVTVAAILFVTIPFGIGKITYFLNASEGNVDVANLIKPYKTNLSNTITTVVKEYIFVMLWSLVFVIPGIIKSYSYFMVDFLIAENPDMDSRRVFEISKQTMYGNKARFFCLQLSFIGYILLSLLTMGIGMLFLEPYMFAAYTEFYKEMKMQAIERGIVIDGELN